MTDAGIKPHIQNISLFFKIIGAARITDSTFGKKFRNTFFKPYIGPVFLE